MKKRKWIIGILILLILGAGAYTYWGVDYFQQKNDSQTSTGILAADIDLDAAVEVTTGTIRETVSTSGYIQPENATYLSFASTGTTGGTVEEILVETGDRVEKDQALVKLEDKQENLNYLKAKNEYELAKISASPSTIEEKQLTMEVALDNYESKTLKAPFAGKIVKIFIEEGDFIEGTDDVIYLIDDTSYEVEVPVDEVDCLKIEVGQKAEVTLDILEDQVFMADVVEVAEYANQSSGVVTVPITLRMENVSPYFKPGYSSTAEIIIEQTEDAIRIPITALTEGNRGSMVLKVEGEQVVPTPVQTGISDGYYQQITSGLDAGDRIIVNNYQMNEENSGGGFGGQGMMMGGGMSGRPLRN